MSAAATPSGFFFFNDTATTEIYPLSLHDALPISLILRTRADRIDGSQWSLHLDPNRSEEHTSELQSRQYLACRLLLEKTRVKMMCTMRVCELIASTHQALCNSCS